MLVRASVGKDPSPSTLSRQEPSASQHLLTATWWPWPQRCISARSLQAPPCAGRNRRSGRPGLTPELHGLLRPAGAASTQHHREITGSPGWGGAKTRACASLPSLQSPCVTSQRTLRSRICVPDKTAAQCQEALTKREMHGEYNHCHYIVHFKGVNRANAPQ